MKTVEEVKTLIESEIDRLKEEMSREISEGNHKVAELSEAQIEILNKILIEI